MLEVRTYNKETDNFPMYLPNDPYGSNADTIFNNTEPCNYITFDGLGINLLDESLKFYEEGDFRGYTNGLSDENCVVQDGSTLLIGYSETVDAYPLKMTIQFKDLCCTEIDISYRNLRGLPIDGDTISVNSKFVTIEFKRGYFTVDIKFTKTVYPNQYIRLESFIFGTINVFTRFKSHNLIEEINVLSDDLPINQFQASFVNPEHLPLVKKEPLTVMSNGRYYGTFYITNAKRTADTIYEVTAQNAVGVLDGVVFDEWYLDSPNPLSFGYDGFIEKIKNVSGITITPDFESKTVETNSGFTFEVTAKILWAVGYIPVKNCRYALCVMGFIFGFMVDGSRNQDILLRAIPTEISSVILTADRRILGDAVLDKSDVITTAKLLKHAGFERQDMVTKSYPHGGKYYFDESPVVDVNADSPVSDLYWNANYLEFTSDNETNFSIGPAKINSDIYYIANPDVTEEAPKELNLANFNVSGYVSFSENIPDLIGGPIIRDADVLKFIQSKGKVIAKIRLRGEKVGDLIQIETAWNGIITGIITKMDITFGYEDIANIEVLEWNL